MQRPLWRVIFFNSHTLHVVVFLRGIHVHDCLQIVLVSESLRQLLYQKGVSMCVCVNDGQVLHPGS